MPDVSENPASQNSVSAIHLTRCEPDTPGIGAYYWAFSGLDVTVVAENLEAYIMRYLPEISLEKGYVCAQPHRRLLMVRDVTTGDDFFNGVGLMAPYSFRQFDQAKQEDRVSPHVYLHRNNTTVQVTVAPKDGAPDLADLGLGFTFTQDPLFQDLINP